MAVNATVIIPFSGSTQGKPIKVVATATAGTAIHSTGISATVVDRIYMFAYNGHTADLPLTIEFGGVAVPDNTLIQTIPFKQGQVLVMDGQPLLGNGSVAQSIAAFCGTPSSAGTANVITIWGWVMRITP